MDEYGSHGLWKGKNFVFDRRGAMAPEGEEGYVRWRCEILTSRVQW